jgi:hypothetical protein
MKHALRSLTLWAARLGALGTDARVVTARYRAFGAIGKERSGLNGYKQTDMLRIG